MDASTQTASSNNQPANPPFIRSGHLAAPGFSEHRIYWEEYGSLAGEPVIVMHGGPGAGSHGSSARFFNPQRYRVVLFDQRGCGKSTPSASDDDATPALTDNTTQHLIDDVSALRDELNINGKMHVFGASWGSTLAIVPEALNGADHFSALRASLARTCPRSRQVQWTRRSWPCQ